MSGNRSVAYAFGAGGLACVVVGALVLDASASLPLLALSLTFVVVATGALATWPGARPLTFVALWVLAVALVAVWVSETDDALESGPRFTLYIGFLFGTFAYLAWAATGLAAWGLWRVAARPKT